MRKTFCILLAALFTSCASLKKDEHYNQKKSPETTIFIDGMNQAISKGVIKNFPKVKNVYDRHELNKMFEQNIIENSKKVPVYIVLYSSIRDGEIEIDGENILRRTDRFFHDAFENNPGLMLKLEREENFLVHSDLAKLLRSTLEPVICVFDNEKLIALCALKNKEMKNFFKNTLRTFGTDIYPYPVQEQN